MSTASDAELNPCKAIDPLTLSDNPCSLPALTLGSQPNDQLSYAEPEWIGSFVKITPAFVESLRFWQLPAEGLRLALELVYLTQQHADGHLYDEASRPEAIRSEADLGFCHTTDFWPSCETSALQNGLAVLQATNLFHTLELSFEAQQICWRFADGVLDQMRDRQVAFDKSSKTFDINSVRSLPHALAIELYLLVCLAGGTRPRINLPLADLATRLGHIEPCWSKLSASVLDALQMVCAQMRITMLARLEWTEDPSKASRLVLIVLHNSTRWRTRAPALQDPRLCELIVVRSTGLAHHKPNDTSTPAMEDLLYEGQGAAW